MLIDDENIVLLVEGVFVNLWVVYFYYVDKENGLDYMDWIVIFLKLRLYLVVKDLCYGKGIGVIDEISFVQFVGSKVFVDIFFLNMDYVYSWVVFWINRYLYIKVVKLFKVKVFNVLIYIILDIINGIYVGNVFILELGIVEKVDEMILELEIDYVEVGFFIVFCILGLIGIILGVVDCGMKVDFIVDGDVYILGILCFKLF